jgi:sec-independent protein translocase protein TatC
MLENEMEQLDFYGHLEELRKRLIYCVLYIIFFTSISLFFGNDIVNSILLLPARQVGLKLINLRPFGQILLYFKVSFFVGFIISIPFAVHQLWLFLRPALLKNERVIARNIILSSFILSIIGALFIFYLFLPISLKFVVEFGSNYIENQIDIEEYLSLLIMLFTGAIIIFELPIIAFIFSYFGILKSSFMKKYRRHALVVIFILSAILSPGTDPVSQILLAIPFIILYEISIWVCKFTEKIKIKGIEN